MSVKCSIVQQCFMLVSKVLCVSSACFIVQWFFFPVSVKYCVSVNCFSDVFYFIEMVHMSVKCSIVQQYFMLVSKVLCVSSACFIVQWFFFSCVSKMCCFSKLFQWCVVCHSSVFLFSVNCMFRWNAACFSSVFYFSNMFPVAVKCFVFQWCVQELQAADFLQRHPDQHLPASVWGDQGPQKSSWASCLPTACK